MAQKLVGSPVKRKGAVRNLTGHETFLDDISFPGILCCRCVRSTYAHARIVRVDTTKALRIPVVAAVITSKEMARLSVPLKVDIFPGNPNIKPLHYQYLAGEKTRFAGEPIVAIIAENGYTAADAAELIEVEYEPLPVVANAADAMRRGSPLLYDEWGDNLMYKIDFQCGDLEAAFMKADKVVKETFKSHRYMPCPMEGRGVAARHNPADGSLEFWASTQHVHIERLLLARALRMDEQRIRVSAPSVGGGFGMKLGFFSESVVVAVASMITGRPVKWVEDRREHLLASSHAREIEHNVEVALTRDGRILGVKDKAVGDLAWAPGIRTAIPWSFLRSCCREHTRLKTTNSRHSA
jgi:carbon-monoxide dehydrogenase large subunit